MRICRLVLSCEEREQDYINDASFNLVLLVSFELVTPLSLLACFNSDTAFIFRINYIFELLLHILLLLRKLSIARSATAAKIIIQIALQPMKNRKAVTHSFQLIKALTCANFH